MPAAFVRVELDPNDVFSTSLSNYAHLIQNASYHVAARIEQDITRIIVRAFTQAIMESGMPDIYGNHLLQGVESRIWASATASSGHLVTEVYGIEDLGTWEDLITGMHYHALAAEPATDGRKFSRTNVNLISLPYYGQEMYNQNRPERRLAFWEHIVSGQTYTVNVRRRNRGEGGGYNEYSFEVPTAGMYDETLRARVDAWGSKYPEWLLLDSGSSGTPTILPMHIRYMVEEKVRSFMEAEWRIMYNTLLDAWDSEQRSYERAARAAAAARQYQEDLQWQRFYDRHINEEMRSYEYSYDSRGRGSQIRGPKGRWA